MTKYKWKLGAFRINLTARARAELEPENRHGLIWCSDEGKELFGICQRFVIPDRMDRSIVWFDLIHIPTRYLISKSKNVEVLVYAAPRLSRLNWENVNIVNDSLVSDYGFKEEVAKILDKESLFENQLFHYEYINAESRQQAEQRARFVIDEHEKNLKEKYTSLFQRFFKSVMRTSL